MVYLQSDCKVTPYNREGLKIRPSFITPFLYGDASLTWVYDIPFDRVGHRKGLYVFLFLVMHSSLNKAKRSAKQQRSDLVIVFLVHCSQGSVDQSGWSPTTRRSYIAQLLTAAERCKNIFLKQNKWIFATGISKYNQKIAVLYNNNTKVAEMFFIESLSFFSLRFFLKCRKEKPALDRPNRSSTSKVSIYFLQP